MLMPREKLRQSCVKLSTLDKSYAGGIRDKSGTECMGNPGGLSILSKILVMLFPVSLCNCVQYVHEELGCL